MAKSVSNKQQMSKLVQLMECNLDIAKGMCSKSHAKERWESFSKILNSLGPPVKSCERWARVWVDLKSKTKKKLIKKRAEIKANNDNLSILNTLSPLDVAVDQILDFSSSIDPLEEDGRSYIAEQNDDDYFSLSNIKEELETENEATVSSFEGSASSSASIKHRKISSENADTPHNESFLVSNAISNIECKNEIEIENEATVSSFEGSAPSPPPVKRRKSSSGNGRSQRMNLLLTHSKEERKFHKDICKRLDGIECAINMIRYEQKEHHQEMQNIKKEKLRLIKENNEKNEKYRAEKLQILRNIKKKC